MMIKNLFIKISKWLEISTVQPLKLSQYEVHYLVDCGAGYMGGKEGPILAFSIDEVLSGFRKNDVEKVYCDGELVYKASWSDDQGIIINKVGIE